MVYAAMVNFTGNKVLLLHPGYSPNGQKNEILTVFFNQKSANYLLYLPTNRIKLFGTIIRVHLQPNNKLN